MKHRYWLVVAVAAMTLTAGCVTPPPPGPEFNITVLPPLGTQEDKLIANTRFALTAGIEVSDDASAYRGRNGSATKYATTMWASDAVRFRAKYLATIFEKAYVFSTSERDQLPVKPDIIIYAGASNEWLTRLCDWNTISKLGIYRNEVHTGCGAPEDVPYTANHQVAILSGPITGDVMAHFAYARKPNRYRKLDPVPDDFDSVYAHVVQDQLNFQRGFELTASKGAAIAVINELKRRNVRQNPKAQPKVFISSCALQLLSAKSTYSAVIKRPQQAAVTQTFGGFGNMIGLAESVAGAPGTFNEQDRAIAGLMDDQLQKAEQAQALAGKGMIYSDQIPPDPKCADIPETRFTAIPASALK